jgi:cytochrome c oxidase accessory protein FixG
MSETVKSEASAPKTSEPKASKKAAATTGSDEKIVSLYEAAIKIHPRNVKGVFTSWRWIMVWATQLFFYGMPWINWGQRQALLFNLDAKRFYIFGLVLYPQDLIYLTTLLIISALSLFLFTAVAGRLWCGYTCPQTVYTEIFLWIESRIEGDRPARMKLDKATLIEKLPRRGTKHLVWIAVALWTGFTFVGYFTPIRELMSSLLHNAMSGWETFWVLFYGFATYGNAGFMREQVCKYMCPYARFQSVMFDNDTMVVAYDEARGEPRGSRSKKDSASILKDKSLGSCIDCTLCVQVCPTGIDIRDGLQYMCIGCGACVDACDSIMDKMNYPRGLIKYSTLHGIAEKWSRKEMLAHIVRPRVLVYASILLLLVTGMLVSLANRDSFRVDVVRDRGVMARIEDSKVENVYRLQIMNATEATQQYQIGATGLDNMEVEVESGNEKDTNKPIMVKSAEALGVTVDLKIPDGSVESGSHKIAFVIKSLDTNETISEKSIFLVPR